MQNQDGRRLITRRGLLACVAGFGGTSLLAACGAPVPSAVAPTSVPIQQATVAPAAAPTAQARTSSSLTSVSYAVSSDPATLNPLLDDTGASMSGYELMFEALVRPDPNTGTPGPFLATGWDQSTDGLTWTFHIRPNVTWSDGQPFTADDVKFTFDTLLDSKTRTPYRSRLTNVASFDAPDKSTFRVSLKTSDCPFLVNTMQIPIVPQHLLAGSADINSDEFGSSRPVGTGPFAFKEWQRSDHLTLVANPTYWQGRPKIDQWVRRSVSDDNVLQALLKTGEVDYAGVSFGAMQEMLAQPNLTFQSVASPILITFIAYNLERPFFQDKRVRQALTYALDRQTMVNSLLYGQGEVLNSSIASVSWAYTSDVPTFAYDVEAARKLLADAGWTPGADGILQKDGTRFSFVLTTNSSNKERVSIVTIAQDAWRKVGVDVQAQLLDTGAFFAKYQQSNDFDAIVAGGAGLTIDPDQTNFWSSNSIAAGTNFVHYRNPMVDQVLEQARSAPGCGPDARKPFYDEFQKLLADDQPFTFLYTAKSGVFINKRLHNVVLSPWIGSSPYIAWGIKDWTVSE
jgi:peptide/nickel transport system substrate-binding protein